MYASECIFPVWRYVHLCVCVNFYGHVTVFMSMFVCTCAGGHISKLCVMYVMIGGLSMYWIHVCAGVCLCLCFSTGVISGEYTQMSGLSTSYTRVHSALSCSTGESALPTTTSGPATPSIKLVCGLVPYLCGQISRTALEKQRSSVPSGCGNPCDRELCTGSNTQEVA